MGKTINGVTAAGAIALAAVLGFGGTYAYFTYLRETKNRFTVGYNEITVTEEYDPPDEIVPGEDTVFSKKVQVENTGTVPCYVRVRLEYSDSGMKQFCTNILGEKRAPAEEWGESIEEISGGKWVFGEDGWYYYRDILAVGERTALLLERVEIHVPQERGEEAKEFEILVYGESIQTLINRTGADGEQTAVEAADYREAWEQILTASAEEGGGL